MEFLQENGIHIDESADVRVMSKGIILNGRKWYAQDYGLFRKIDQTLWLGRVKHFVYVHQNDSYSVFARVYTYECEGSADNLNFVYCVDLTGSPLCYVPMQNFRSMAVVTPHWTDNSLACAIMVDPVFLT